MNSSRPFFLGLVLLGSVVLLFTSPVIAQDAAGIQVNPSSSGVVDNPNPLTVLQDVANAIPGTEGRLSAVMNIMLLLTVLALVPSILILCTCFIRLVIVFGLLRQALGTQGLPPSQVVVGLSLFLTLVVMAPTLERMYNEGIKPYADGEQNDYRVAWDRTKQPLRDFMFGQLEATGNWSSLYMILNYRGVDTSEPEKLKRSDVDMISLIPAYVLSELKTAFLIGFRIYLPFLVIDMVVASILISMGMLMLPPVLISLPFKLLLFVLVDGWALVAGSLLASVAQGEGPVGMTGPSFASGP